MGSHERLAVLQGKPERGEGTMTHRSFDANDGDITRALKQAGACVWHIGSPDKGGIPDKLVAIMGHLYLLEIKVPKTGRLSKAQRERHAEMARHGVKVHIVKTIKEALDAIGVTPEKNAERRRALGEIAAGIRKKSDDFEKRAKLVSGKHDYRSAGKMTLAEFAASRDRPSDAADKAIMAIGDACLGRDPMQRYKTPEGDPWADPGSTSKIPDEV